MFAFAVVEQLDVIKDIASGLISGRIDFPHDLLGKPANHN
jgi:hypothetical protein